jgi:hypothetical protein
VAPFFCKKTLARDDESGFKLNKGHMNKLDSFFKNKLDDRQVPFQEAHWEDAMAMLDERDKKRRRGIIWWWLTGGFMVIILAMGIYWVANKYIHADSTTKKDAAETSALATTAIQPDSTTSNEAKSEAFIQGSEQRQSTANDDTDKLSSFEQVWDTSRELEKTEIDHSIEKNHPKLDQSTVHPGLSAQETIAPDGSILNHENQRATSIQAQTNVAGKLSSNNNTSSIDESEVTDKLKNETTFPATINADGAVSVKDATTQEETAELVENSVKEQRAVESLPSIAGKFFIVKYENTSDTFSKEEREAIADVTRIKKLKWIIGAGAMLNPSNGERLLGVATDLRISYPLNKSISAYARTAYRRQGGSFGNIQQSRQINFRFGATEERFSLKPTHLHYINSGVGLSKQWQKHQIGIGLTHQYLLGIRGELTSTQKGAFTTDFTNPTAEESGWLDEKGFVKNMFGGELFYQFRLHNRIGLQLRCFYWPSTVLNEEVSIPREVRLQEYGPVFIDFGINYHL